MILMLLIRSKNEAGGFPIYTNLSKEPSATNGGHPDKCRCRQKMKVVLKKTHKKHIHCKSCKGVE